MKYELRIERRAQKQLAKIAQPDRDRIISAVRSLAEQPRPVEVKKLTGREAWRIRVGHYRILYEIHDQALVIFVIKISYRKDVYRGE